MTSPRRQSKKARFAHRAAISRRYTRGFNRWAASIPRPGLMDFAIIGNQTIFTHPDSEPMEVDALGRWRKIAFRDQVQDCRLVYADTRFTWLP